MIFHDIQQNTDEWMDLRAGKVTSSSMATVMANYGKAFGDPAKKLAQKIALERHTGKRIETDHYINAAMRRGHELEPVARNKYEKEEFRTVTNGGFIESDDGKQGTSLDGRIGGRGATEIKCPLQDAHWGVIKKGGFSSQYKWQIHHQIMVAGLEWEDFVSYCPEFPEGKQLHIYRIYRDEELIEMMKVRLAEFEEMVEENRKLLK